MAERTFLGNLRLALLIAVLIFVALGAYLDRTRSTDWDAPLRVTVYALAASDDPGVRSYVTELDASAFRDAETFLSRQARDYGVPLEQVVRVRVSHAASQLPPALPARAGTPTIMWWSLRMRYWAWRVAANDPLPTPDVQVFALYHPAESGRALPDSLGLSKGLMAVAQLFAAHDSERENQVVLVHELLHTLGASDRYDRNTGRPTVPDGLGDALQEPRFPQRRGEIMAGRIAVSATEAVIPQSLDVMTVGSVTAREIGWSR